MTTTLTKYTPRAKRPASVAIDHAAVTTAIAGRLKHCRIHASITQEELGARLGVSFQQIQKYETGANGITASRLIQYCRALGVFPLEILGDVMEAEALDMAA